jgi:hypothetical protein
VPRTAPGLAGELTRLQIPIRPAFLPSFIVRDSAAHYIAQCFAVTMAVINFKEFFERPIKSNADL